MTNLYNIRRERGQTLRELASEIGVPHQNLHRWERGITFPTASNRAKLCNALSLPPHVLLAVLLNDENPWLEEPGASFPIEIRRDTEREGCVVH